MNSMPASSAICASFWLLSHDASQASGAVVMVMPPEQFGANRPSLKALPPRMRVSLRCIECSPVATERNQRRPFGGRVRHQPTDDDGGRAALEHLFELAVERADRAAQNGGAGLERRPIRAGETLGAAQFGLAAEDGDQLLVRRREVVDGKVPRV